MPLNFITHQNKKYPSWQAEGNAARWILPLSQYHCIGKGYDIGYSKEAWMLPGAIGIEPSIDAQWDAMKLPSGEVDYIFSSHCLEHVQRNWYDVIDYWLSKIRIGGILFLYLPHASQSYWHPSSNRKHIHSFNGSEIEAYLDGLGHKVYVSGPDFNNSFVVVCEKVDIKTGLSKSQMEELQNAWKEAKKHTINVQFGVPNGDGDVFMPGCFDKSIKDGKFHLEDHKPTITKVTTENKSQYPDIPNGHYIIDNK